MLGQALQKVYRRAGYVVLTLAVSIGVFILAVWLPNIGLIANVVTSPEISFVAKLKLPVSLLGSIVTNFTLLSASYTIIIAVLFGVYVGMMTYFLKRRITEVGKGGIATGFLGIASGVLGVGCAACGSFLLTSLSLVGASGILTVLPLGGSEFGIIGVFFLVVAVFLTAKKIVNPLVCKIEN